jgi:hypothetical protein
MPTDSASSGYAERMTAYWMHSAVGVMAAGHAKTQPPGIPYLTVFGVIGTFIGVVAATQQFISAFRRRKYASAEKSFCGLSRLAMQSVLL